VLFTGRAFEGLGHQVRIISPQYVKPLRRRKNDGNDAKAICTASRRECEAGARLEDCRPRLGQVWNRIPDDIRDKVVQLALDEPTLSPRELATRFTDWSRRYQSVFVAHLVHSLSGRLVLSAQFMEP